MLNEEDPSVPEQTDATGERPGGGDGGRGRAPSTSDLFTRPSGGGTPTPATPPSTGGLSSFGGRQISTGLVPQAEAIQRRFGLRLSGGHRTPERNRRAGGVEDSYHLQTGEGGALDFVGSESAMVRAVEYAKQNGATEAFVHDAGSGRHAHIGYNGRRRDYRDPQTYQPQTTAERFSAPRVGPASEMNFGATQNDVSRLPYVDGANEANPFNYDDNATNQPFMHKVGGLVTQSLGEIVGGTIAGAGWLGEVINGDVFDVVRGTEGELGNILTRFGDSIKEAGQEFAPIYTTHQVDEGLSNLSNLVDPDYWLSRGPQIVSTLSLMIPARAVGGIASRGASALAGLVGAEQMAGRAGFIAGGLASAVASRHMENMMEASESYKAMMAEGERLGLSPEETAKGAAAAASATYKNDWAALIFDIPSYMLMMRGPQMANAASAERLADTGFGVYATAAGRAKQGFRRSVMNAVERVEESGTLVQSALEGAEEIVQGAVSRDAQAQGRQAMGVKDEWSSMTLGERFANHLTNPETWEAGLWGGLGGAIFSGAGKFIENRAARGEVQTEAQNLQALQARANSTRSYLSEMKTHAENGSPEGVLMARDALLANVGVTAAADGKMSSQIDFFNAVANMTDEELAKENMTPEDREEAGKSVSVLKDIEKDWNAVGAEIFMEEKKSPDAVRMVNRIVIGNAQVKSFLRNAETMEARAAEMETSAPGSPMALELKAKAQAYREQAEAEKANIADLWTEKGRNNFRVAMGLLSEINEKAAVQVERETSRSDAANEIAKDEDPSETVPETLQVNLPTDDDGVFDNAEPLPSEAGGVNEGNLHFPKDGEVTYDADPADAVEVDPKDVQSADPVDDWFGEEPSTSEVAPTDEVVGEVDPSEVDDLGEASMVEDDTPATSELDGESMLNEDQTEADLEDSSMETDLSDIGLDTEEVAPGNVDEAAEEALQENDGVYEDDSTPAEKSPQVVQAEAEMPTEEDYDDVGEVDPGMLRQKDVPHMHLLAYMSRDPQYKPLLDLLFSTWGNQGGDVEFTIGFESRDAVNELDSLSPLWKDEKFWDSIPILISPLVNGEKTAAFAFAYRPSTREGKGILTRAEAEVALNERRELIQRLADGERVTSSVTRKGTGLLKSNVGQSYPLGAMLEASGNDVVLAASTPTGEIVDGNENILTNRTAAKKDGRVNAGNIYAIVDAPNGERFPVRVRPRNLTKREAALVWNLFRALKTKGPQGQFTSQDIHEQQRELIGEVSGSVGELLNYFVYQGERTLSYRASQQQERRDRVLHLDSDGFVQIGDVGLPWDTFVSPTGFQALVEHVTTHKLRNVSRKTIGKTMGDLFSQDTVLFGKVLEPDTLYDQFMVETGALTTEIKAQPQIFENIDIEFAWPHNEAPISTVTGNTVPNVQAEDLFDLSDDAPVSETAAAVEDSPADLSEFVSVEQDMEDYERDTLSRLENGETVSEPDHDLDALEAEYEEYLRQNPPSEQNQLEELDLDNLDSGTTEGPGVHNLFRTVQGVPQDPDVFDREIEVAWLKAKLPQFPVSEIEGLIYYNDQGVLNPDGEYVVTDAGEAIGLFDPVTNLISLSSDRTRGTAYHEAWHAFSFGILNTEQRKALREEALDHFGKKALFQNKTYSTHSYLTRVDQWVRSNNTDDRMSEVGMMVSKPDGEWKSIRELSPEALEQWLSDGGSLSMEYYGVPVPLNIEDLQEGVSDFIYNTFLEERLAEDFRYWKNSDGDYPLPYEGSAIPNLFQRMLEWIRGFLNMRPTIMEAFRRLDRGYYSQAVANRIEGAVAPMRVGKMDASQTREAVEILSYVAIKAAGISTVDQISLLGTDSAYGINEPNLPRVLFERIKGTIAYNRKNGNDLIADRYLEIGQNLKTLLPEINRYLASFGIAEKLVMAERETANEEGTEVGTGIESFVKSNYETSAKDGARASIKMFLSLQPVLTSFEKNAEGKYIGFESSPFLGAPRFHRPGTMWKMIQDSVRNAVEHTENGVRKSAKDIFMERLKKAALVEPNIASVVNQIETYGEDFVGQFYQSFHNGDNNFLMYLTDRKTEMQYDPTGQEAGEVETYSARSIQAQIDTAAREIKDQWSQSFIKRYTDTNGIQRANKLIDYFVGTLNEEGKRVDGLISRADSATEAQILQVLKGLGIELTEKALQFHLQTQTKQEFLRQLQWTIYPPTENKRAEDYSLHSIASGKDTAEESLFKTGLFSALARAEVRAAGPSQIESHVMSYGGKTFYPDSSFSPLMELIQRINNGDERALAMGNARPLTYSYIFQRILNEPKFRESISYATLAGLREQSSSEAPTGWPDVKMPDEIAFKFNSVLRGIVQGENSDYVTMNEADRSSMHMLTGLPLLTNDTNFMVHMENGKLVKIGRKLQEQFEGYIRMELDRIGNVQEEIESFLVSEQAGEKPLVTLIKDFHYTDNGGVKDYTKGNGLKMHLFPEFSANELKISNPDLYEKLYDSNGKPMPHPGRLTKEFYPAIQTFLQNVIDIQTDQFIEQGLMKRSPNGALTQRVKFIPKNIQKAFINRTKVRPRTEGVTPNIYEQMVADFAVSSVAMGIDSSLVLQGDPAFYKGAVPFIDLAKRTVGATVTGRTSMEDSTLAPNTRASEVTNKGTRSHYTTAIVYDDIKASIDVAAHYREATMRYAMRAWRKNGRPLTAQEAESLTSTMFNGYEETNATDAQGMITPARFRELMIGDARWSDARENQYTRLMNGEAIDPKDIEFFLTPIKGVFFDHTPIGRWMVPTYVKYSQATLFPSLVQGTNLEAVVRAMEVQNVDEVVYESAVKVGARGHVNLQDVIAGGAFNPMRLPQSGWRLQVDTPTHGIGNTKIGTQQRKLIYQVIDPLYDYNVNGEALTGSQMRRRMTAVHQALSDLGFQKLQREFDLDSEGRITNPEKALETLKDELTRQGAPLNRIQMLQTEGGEIQAPLSASPEEQAFQYLLFSIYNSRTVQTKTRGAALIQMSGSGYGIRRYSEVEGVERATLVGPLTAPRMETIENEDGSTNEVFVPGSVLLPASVMSQIPNADRLTAEEWQAYFAEDPSLLKGILYRIPNQAPASIDPVQIAGFLPAEAGDIVVMYDEITSKAGPDFDVDKMYAILPTYRTRNVYEETFDAEGNPVEPTAETPIIGTRIERVTAPYGPKMSQAALGNYMIDLYHEIFASPRGFSKLTTPIDAYNLKGLAEEVRKLGKETVPSGGYWYSVAHQTNIHQRMMAGQGLIGSFANQVTDHSTSVAEGAFINTPQGSEKVSHLLDSNGREVRVDAEYTEDGYPVDVVLSAYMNAVVDLAKDDYVLDLGTSLTTSNIIAVMLRNGISPKRVSLFLAQPAVKRLVHLTQMDDASHSKREDGLKPISQVKKELREALEKEQKLQTYQGIPIKNVTGMVRTSASGKVRRIGARIDYKKGIILLDREVLQETFDKQSWTKPGELADGSRAQALEADTFTDMEDFLTFVMEHERQRTLISQRENEEKGDYETRINNAALKELSRVKQEGNGSAFSEATLASGISGDKSRAGIANQLLYLEEYEAVEEMGRVLSDLVLSSKVDVEGVTTDFATLWAKENQRERSFENSSTLDARMTSGFQSAFYTNSVGKVMNTMKNLFIQASDPFRESITTALLYQRKDKTSSSDLIRKVMKKVFAGVVSTSPVGMSLEEITAIMDPETGLAARISVNPKVMDNLLVSHFTIEGGEIKLMAGKISNDLRDFFTDSWEDMIYSPDPEVAAIGKDLVKYAMMSGMEKYLGSFYDLIPVKYFQENGFFAYMNDVLKSRTSPYNAGMVQDALRHFANDSSIVPTFGAEDAGRDMVMRDGKRIVLINPEYMSKRGFSKPAFFINIDGGLYRLTRASKKVNTYEVDFANGDGYRNHFFQTPAASVEGENEGTDSPAPDLPPDVASDSTDLESRC